MVRASSQGARSAEGKYPLLLLSVPPARRASQLNCIETHREGQEEVNGMSGTKGEVLVWSDASEQASFLTKPEVFTNRALRSMWFTRWCQAIKGRYSNIPLCKLTQATTKDTANLFIASCLQFIYSLNFAGHVNIITEVNRKSAGPAVITCLNLSFTNDIRKICEKLLF